MKEIKLADVLDIRNPEEFKAHCAIWNQTDEPLDVFARDREEWKGWNSYKGKKNEFNRPYIFSMIRFHTEDDTWLFGGIWRVLGLEDKKYKIELSEHSAEFIGRLKVKFRLNGRNQRVKLESIYSKLLVTEVLKEPYSGDTFPGYEDIDLRFNELESIYKNQKPDWYGALKSIKGVYLISDLSNGKKYIGSAYGSDGIWSRWGEYIKTGHGKSEQLVKLIKLRGRGHALKNFKFTLLEYRPARVDDHVIITREAFWKKALLSRGDYGYNLN